MRLRTFTAPDMPAAMKMVREALGSEAVILATEVLKNQKGVNVTAAVEIEDNEPHQPFQRTTPAPMRHPVAEPLRFKLQECLRFHNIPEMFIAKIMGRMNDKELSAMRKPTLEGALQNVLASFFSFDPIAFTNGKRIMLVGPPGVGKTLTIARIAAQLVMNKLPLIVITTDNKRAGGIEQLQAFTDILDVPLHVAANKNELAKHIATAGDRTRVLIDTAGCNPYDAEEISVLKAYVLSGIEPVLVLPAGGDSLEAIDMAEAYVEAFPIERLLVTRADTARRFGGILAAAAAHKLAFCHATGSASISEPLRSLDAGLLARLMLQYQLQTN